jgi:alkylation response protein AidB-like acyl-CoA dehydrogenase
MALALSDAHRALAEVARSFLQGEKATQAARDLLDATDEALPPFWSSLADLGWLGLHLPEQYGGSGYGISELAVVLEELGRVVAPGPFLPTVIASAVIADQADPATRERLLPSLGDGSAVAGLGVGGTVGLDSGIVSGDAGVVLGANGADLFVLAVGPDVVLLPRTRAGVVVTAAPNLDPTRRCGRVQLDGVVLEDGELLEGARGRAADFARTLAAAEASGGAHQCVEMAAEYAKVRKQFGRVIGTFGAVKQHCANMLVAAELATAAVWDAARAASGDARQFSLASAIAAAQAVPAYYRNAQLNIQVHGGIGYTWEHDGHMFLRRSAALSGLFEPRLAAADVTGLVEAGVQRDQSLGLPPEAEAVRADLSGLLTEIAALPPDEQRSRLIDAGLVMPHWPKPWGREAKALEQLVIDQEFDRVGLGRPNFGITGWIMLTLIQRASPEQIDRWVPPTLEGKLMWCQLFSEPDAGSDAAGIRTRGTKVEGGWLVNGQKVWTSGAQYCQFGLATIRTDPDARKHAGITAMVIDMNQEGVEVRPLREASGGAAFNEVFFNDVFVPDSDVVGGVNDGWSVARSTLGNERVSIGGSGPVREGPDLLALYLDNRDRVPGAAAIVGEILAENQAMRNVNLRRAERAISGGEPGPEGNVTKLLSAEHAQRVADAALTLAGPEAALMDGLNAAVGRSIVFSRALSIAGGTSEITRNQIAERILGLPRDPLIG